MAKAKTPDEKADEKTIEFLEKKKQEMKKSQYREKFDALASEIEINLLNTSVSYGQKLYEKSGWGSMVFYNKMANGAYDINVYPQKLTDRDQNRSGVPVSQEPIAFSKIMIATSVLAGKLPDATVIADDKVYARAMYDLWKRGWSMKGANGTNTLMTTYQNLFTYGWAAWRVYPRRVQVDRGNIKKILFDDVYREPLDPKRTWMGVGFNLGDYWSQFEVYYEKDMPKDEFFDKYPAAEKNKGKKDYLQYCTVSKEATDENSEKVFTHVTIGYYENVLLNRYIVACGKMKIYDGEMPNDDSNGSVVIARCFVKNPNDPHGVGLYEMMRGNTALYTYINSLNAQQVEAEIFPLLFGPQVQNGTATYKRGPNIVNPKQPGSTIDIVRTTGNVQQGIAFADKQKLSIEENTGVNNIVAGQNGENNPTLGNTVIQKEAAFNRLTPPRNSMVDALQTDAHIANSWVEQTYPMDKVFMIDSEGDVANFAQQNPGYFIEAQPVVGDDGQPTGKHMVLASQNLRLNFDFTPDGEMLDNQPTRTISAKRLFDEMNAHGHKSDYIEWIIDPDSMLLPSLEIQRQTFGALFPIITNQVTSIYSMRSADPEAAMSQLGALEQLLEIHKLDIYKFIPKKQYDDIMSLTPTQFAPQPTPKTPKETLNYKDAPPDVQREIEAMAGLTPSKLAINPDRESVQEMIDYKDAPPDVQREIEAKAGLDPSKLPPFTPPATPGTVPPIPHIPPGGPTKQPTGRPGISDNKKIMQPKGNNQLPRPQSPIGAALDASVGRVSVLPELNLKK
jgi:hypothetical protein